MMDEIDAILPGIPAEEKELRGKLRICRTIATQRIVDAIEGSHDHQLSWMAVDLSTAWMFAPAPIELLRDVVDQCRRLVMAARGAERIHG